MIDCTQITENYLQTVLRQLKTATSGDAPRGLLIFAYCHKDSTAQQARLSQLYRNFHIETQPIQIVFLDDTQGEILLALKSKLAIGKFSSSEKQTFQSHIHLQMQSKDIIKRFRALSLQRLYVGEDGLVKQEMRLTALCLNTFKKAYPKLPPFSFDGFEKKNVAQARKYHTTICTKLLDRSLSNVQSYQSLSLEEKNRVKATLSTEVNTSWKVFDQSCRLNPPSHPVLAELYEKVCENLSLDTEKSLGALFSPFLEMPYGMNENALALFISYFISIQGNEILLSHQGNTIASGHVANIMFKQGKWNRLELFKVTILKNPFAKVDLLAKKCQEVLANTQVKKCSTLQSQLNELVTQTGTTTENQLIHAEAKGYLDEGLPDPLKESMKNKISTLLSHVTQHQAELEAECNEMMTKIQQVTTPTELKKAHQSLHKLSVNTAHPSLEGLLGEAEKLVEALEELPKRLGDFSSFTMPHLPRLYPTFQNIVNTEEQALQKKEDQWIASACLSDESVVEKMDPNACTKWLTMEEKFPEFLSERALTRWKKHKVLVEKRLHESRVEGVIALFHHLNDEERKVCLTKLLAESPLE